MSVRKCAVIANNRRLRFLEFTVDLSVLTIAKCTAKHLQIHLNALGIFECMASLLFWLFLFNVGYYYQPN